VDNELAIFLIIGVVIVVIVGRLLVHSGARYLTNSAAAEKRSLGSAAALVAVLFYLLTLGFVALLAAVPIGGSPQESLLVRLGVLLVVLAIVYGITLGLLSRRRQEAIAAEIDTPRPERDEVRNGVRVEPVERDEQDRLSPMWNQPMDSDADAATGPPRPGHSP